MKRVPTGRTRGGELRGTLIGFLVVAALVGILTAAAVMYATAVGVDFSYLSRDPAAVFNGPNYTGYYANLTILVWQVPATSALLAAAVLRRVGKRSESRMFLLVGLLTAVMAIDDFFMLHETANETFGLSQKAPPLVYALSILALCWVYRHRLGWNILLIAATLGAWGVSAALDAVGLEDLFVVEDGAKLLGVGLWTFVVVRLAFAELLALRESAEPAEPAAEFEADELVEPRRRPRPTLPARAPAALPHPADDDPADDLDDLVTAPVPTVPRQTSVDQETVLRPAVGSAHNGSAQNGSAQNGSAQNGSAQVDSQTVAYSAGRPRHGRHVDPAAEPPVGRPRRARPPAGEQSSGGHRMAEPPSGGHRAEPARRADPRSGEHRNGHAAGPPEGFRRTNGGHRRRDED